MVEVLRILSIYLITVPVEMVKVFVTLVSEGSSSFGTFILGAVWFGGIFFAPVILGVMFGHSIIGLGLLPFWLLGLCAVLMSRFGW